MKHAKQKPALVFFQEGSNAFLRGKDLLDCPYRRETDEALNWEDGWIAESEIFDAAEEER